MISQIVFDLPLEGPFDYLIPEHLASQVIVGMRVKVSFGPKTQIGLVTDILAQSVILKLKPIISLCEPSAVFNELDLNFARQFSAYYGCSLGEALFTLLRNKEVLKPSISRGNQSKIVLYRSLPEKYVKKIQEIINGYSAHSRFLLLVPDASRGQLFIQQFKGIGSIKIGMRSSVFESDGQYDAVIMVDDEDSSYKQEQTPMYETRQVLLARAKIFGFDIAFLAVSPSVELMALVQEEKIKLIEDPEAKASVVRLVDVSNYKFIPGLISPPVRDALEAALKAGNKSALILNRRGSYRLTRCVNCAEILKCSHCDSSLIYSRIAGEFLCRHCTYTAPGNTVCPQCHKSSWQSIGIGVEQVQAELKRLFSQAKIQAFERASESLGDFDILISTSAILRFQGALKIQYAAFIDFDAELNRLDMRSAFNAFSLVLHMASMTLQTVFIQTRNTQHYVLQYLSSCNWRGYYDEELKLRKEFGFSPFKHWVKINWRGKQEKTTLESAQQVYNILFESSSKAFVITPPLADTVGRKRDLFRFNVMVQAFDVIEMVQHIKSTLSQVKRPSRVIVTLNVDP